MKYLNNNGTLPAATATAQDLAPTNNRWACMGFCLHSRRSRGGWCISATVMMASFLSMATFSCTKWCTRMMLQKRSFWTTARCLCLNIARPSYGRLSMLVGPSSWCSTERRHRASRGLLKKYRSIGRRQKGLTSRHVCDMNRGRTYDTGRRGQ